MQTPKRGHPASRQGGALACLMEVQASARAASGLVEFGGELAERRAHGLLRHIAQETARAQAYLGLPRAA